MTDEARALAVSTGAIVPSSWYAMDRERMSLAFRPDTPFDAWERDTTILLEVARGIQWLVGDALSFGELAYGERSHQIQDPERYRFESINRMGRVARAIPSSRRRPTVGFYQHMAVCGLPLASQEQLLDHAAEYGSTVVEMRALVKAEQHRLERVLAVSAPVPQLALDGIDLGLGDACAIPLPDGSVDLLVTSPPYGLDSATVAKYRVPDESSAWVQLMVEFCREAYRVLAPQGRLCVNVPLDTTTGGRRPTYAQVAAAALAVGFKYRLTIMWVDGHLGKSQARGSEDSPGGINVVCPSETILVCHKGDEWIRPAGSGTSQLDHEGWVNWTNGDWRIAGEGRPWEGFEAAFPLELPRRLLRLFGYREDVVCDPFLGSGTTAVAAWELGRRFHGFDIDPVQVASASRRLALVSKGGRDGEQAAG